MKVLVVSDIHANMAALEAVLEDCDVMVCLGDTVDYGPDPVECLQLVRETVRYGTRGNHDHAVGFGVDCGCFNDYKGLSVATREYTRSVMAQEDMEYLRGLPLYLQAEVDGYKLYFTHAAPSDHLYRYLRPELTEEELAAELAEAGGDFIFVGHTHIPMVRRAGGVTIVNPGSVGQPRDGDPRAAYAVWEDGRVRLKRVDYDRDRTITRLKRLAGDGLSPAAVETLVAILRAGRLP